jgi:nucleotide-binding universal stress UspA family protein
MIPRIKRILYTTDLSDNSAYVFRYAINSAKKHDASIIILHVLEPLSATTNAIVDPYLTEEQEKKISKEKIAYVRDLIQKRLKLFCEKELNNDPDSVDRVESIELSEGFPAEIILRKADEFNCDAIVLGTHGKGLHSKYFFGKYV